jgi:hypothetical protein
MTCDVLLVPFTFACDHGTPTRRKCAQVWCPSHNIPAIVCVLTAIGCATFSTTTRMANRGIVIHDSFIYFTCACRVSTVHYGRCALLSISSHPLTIDRRIRMTTHATYFHIPQRLIHVQLIWCRVTQIRTDVLSYVTMTVCVWCNRTRSCCVIIIHVYTHIILRLLCMYQYVQRRYGVVQQFFT